MVQYNNLDSFTDSHLELIETLHPKVTHACSCWLESTKRRHTYMQFIMADNQRLQCINLFVNHFLNVCQILQLWVTLKHDFEFKTGKLVMVTLLLLIVDWLESRLRYCIWNSWEYSHRVEVPSLSILRHKIVDLMERNIIHSYYTTKNSMLCFLQWNLRISSQSTKSSAYNV